LRQKSKSFSENRNSSEINDFVVPAYAGLPGHAATVIPE
jgi:hypothetical protein